MDVDGREEAFVYDLHVHPYAKRQGVATTLLWPAVDGPVELEVHRSNSNALAFYETYGFVAAKGRKRTNTIKLPYGA